MAPRTPRPERGEGTAEPRPGPDVREDLPATPDYKQRTEIVPAPKGLKPGFYYIIASHDEKFRGAGPVTYTDFFVADLAIVERQDHASGVAPRAGTHRDRRRAGRGRDGPDVDPPAERRVGCRAGRQDGPRSALSRPVPRDRRHMVVVTRNDQILATANDRYVGGRRVEPPREQVVFFTDRSLYRPGQTIHFKGIVIDVDQAKDNYATVPNRNVTVQFCRRERQGGGEGRDAVERLRLDFGQLHRTARSAWGRMHIRSVGLPGMDLFNVEEYKRPKFKVEVEAPKDASSSTTP